MIKYACSSTVAARRGIRYVPPVDRGLRPSKVAEGRRGPQEPLHLVTVLLSSHDFGSRADIHFRKFPSKFVKISQNFQIFLQISENPCNFLAFPEIPAKFREICGEKSPIWRKFSKILTNFANFFGFFNL